MEEDWNSPWQESLSYPLLDSAHVHVIVLSLKAEMNAGVLGRGGEGGGAGGSQEAGEARAARSRSEALHLRQRLGRSAGGATRGARGWDPGSRAASAEACPRRPWRCEGTRAEGARAPASCSLRIMEMRPQIAHRRLRQLPRECETSGALGPDEQGAGRGARPPPEPIRPHKSRSHRLVIIPKACAGSKEALSLGVRSFAGHCLEILRTNTALQWPAFSRNANVAGPAKLGLGYRA